MVRVSATVRAAHDRNNVVIQKLKIDVLEAREELARPFRKARVVIEHGRAGDGPAGGGGSTAIAYRAAE